MTINEQIIQILTDYKGGGFVSMTYDKELVANKDNKGRSIVCRQKYTQLYVGGDYKNKVENRLRGQGVENPNYELSPTWGTHENSVLVEHKGEHYMQAQILNITKCEKTYLIDGEQVSFEDVLPLCRPSQFAKKSPCQKQIAAGVEDVIDVRKFKTSQIKAICIDGNRL